MTCDAGEEPLADRTGCRACSEVSAAHVSALGGECVACQAGYAPNSVQSTCERCPANTISPDGTPCTYCDADPLVRRYLQPNDEQVACLPCPQDTYYVEATDTCNLCGPGFRLNDDRTLMRHEFIESLLRIAGANSRPLCVPPCCVDAYYARCLASQNTTQRRNLARWWVRRASPRTCPFDESSTSV